MSNSESDTARSSVSSDASSLPTDVREIAPTLLPTDPGDAATLPPSTPDNERCKVPGYEILGELGRGGMGVVYRARQVKANRLVALKMILSGSHAGSDERARFRREAESIANLQHPNIIQVYEVGEHEGRPYFSLEYCAGGSLASRLAGSPLPPPQAARIVITLARATQHAHDNKIIHRDLKPANVLLTGDPRDLLDGATLKITDFGLAKNLDDGSHPTMSGAVLGSPSYMAPEQAAGRLDLVGPTSDVYSLGAILYDLLTGRPPFKGETVQTTLKQVCDTEPVPRRG